jgi:hypothetical protein
MDLRETAWGVWIGLDWLRIGTGGELLWMPWWTFGFLRHGVVNTNMTGSLPCIRTLLLAEAARADNITLATRPTEINTRRHMLLLRFHPTHVVTCSCYWHWCHSQFTYNSHLRYISG